MSIMYQIYKSFDDGHEVWSAFLDISKGFDKVWHKDLIFKIKQNNLSSNLLSTLTDFLELIKQRVVLNGKLFSYSNIGSGVPQDSLMGLLFFSIYIYLFQSVLQNI